MKKRGRRCLISLLLGLCLLMPSQMKVLAADAQEDSSSVQAVGEAMPDQENATTIDENQIDNTMQDDQDIAVLADNYPATGKITAKVYLRYSNVIPEKINQAFTAGEFGPSGNNTPYFTVTVNLDQLNKKPVKTYVKTMVGHGTSTIPLTVMNLGIQEIRQMLRTGCKMPRISGNKQFFRP